MNHRKGKRFIRNDLRTNRDGATSMEYVLVCTLIVGISCAAIGVFGETVKDLVYVSKAIGGTKNPVIETNELALSTQADSFQAKEDSASVFHIQLLAITSTLCMLIIGYFYLKLYKKRKREVSSDVCHLAFKEHQSQAISKIHCKRTLINSKLKNEGLAMLGGTEIRPYMSTEIVAVRPTMPIDECSQLLKENGFRRVLVTESDGQMSGVISRKDIASKPGKTVADVMTDNPKTVSPSTNLRVAMSTLVQHRVSCLPIVENGILVGLLSTSDLIVLLQCILLELDGVATKPHGHSELIPQ